MLSQFHLFFESESCRVGLANLDRIVLIVELLWSATFQYPEGRSVIRWPKTWVYFQKKILFNLSRFETGEVPD